MTLQHADPSQSGLPSDTGTIKTGLKLLTSALVSPAAIMAPGISLPFAVCKKERARDVAGEGHGAMSRDAG